MLRREMPISSWWLQGALLTYLFGFSILGVLAYLAYQQQPPIPARVLTASGQALFMRRDDVLDGMNVFQRYGVMQYGTVYGHGAYLGPDFTAEYLHAQRATSSRASMRRRCRRVGRSRASRPSCTATPTTRQRDTLRWIDARGAGAPRAGRLLQRLFSRRSRPAAGLQAHLIPTSEQIGKITAFFAWTAWTASASRPGRHYSYTNNWPPETAGRQPADRRGRRLERALAHRPARAASGCCCSSSGRYRLAGLASEEERRLRLPPAGRGRARRRPSGAAWSFLVVAALFLVQTLLGGPRGALPRRSRRLLRPRLSPVAALQPRPHLAPAARPVLRLGRLPGDGHFPRAHDRRPRAATVRRLAHRSCCSARVVLVVVGSLVGEAASYKGWLHGGRPGSGSAHQGWEYLDLGRLWQILLIVGHGPLGASSCSAASGNACATSIRGNLPYLFLYTALCDPAVLRRRAGLRHAQQLRHRRLLAVLGRPPVGRGLPGAVHHHHGRLHLRAAGRGPAEDGDPRHLPRHHPLLGRRRDRHHAPPLLQRRARGRTWRWARSSRRWKSSRWCC